MENQTNQKTGSDPANPKYSGLGAPEGKFIKDEVIGKGDWQELSLRTYQLGVNEDGSPKLSTWEVYKRVHKNKSDTEFEGVSIFPILRQGDRTHLLLIKEYRAAIDRFVLSFPGGRHQNTSKKLILINF